MSKREEWEALGETGQYKIILSTVAKVAKRQGVKVNPLDYAGETWLKVAEWVDGSALDLPLIVWRAAVSAIGREARQLRKYADADNFTVAGADGDGLGQVLDMVAGSGSVEAEAILRVDFGRFYDTLDASNKKLVSGRAAGYLFREIGPTLPKKMSHAAMEHRLSRLEKRVASFIG